MTTTKKLLEKIRHQQHDWRMEQLEIIAKHYDIKVRKSGGSHVVFTHTKWAELICIPAHRPIKQIYIKKLVLLLDALEEKI